MRLRNKTSTFAVSILAAVGLGLAMSFNSCSDVEFTKASSVSPQEPQCEGDQCPTPVQFIDYDDTFNITAYSHKADILLVLDNSGSMKPDLLELAGKLNGLIGVLETNMVDWQMCYITTDDIDSGATLDWKKINQNNEVVSTGLRVLLPTTVNKESIFMTTVDNLPRTDTTGNEQGLVVMKKAFQNTLNRDCFRSDAVLSVVLISDEDEKSCGGRCQHATSSENPDGTQYRAAQSYRDQYKQMGPEDVPDNLVAAVNSLWPEKPFVVNSIVINKNDKICYDAQDSTHPAFYGLTYSQLQATTGGILGDICAANYSTQLAEMGKRTVDTVKSVTLRCAPVRTPTVTITPEAPAITWSQTGNKILFSEALPEGSVVNVKYSCAVKL